jgi:hypothetical protein
VYEVSDGKKTVRVVNADRRAAKVKITLTRAEQAEMAKYVLKAIKKEIAKDTARVSSFRKKGDPVPIPRTKRFAESFTVKVVAGRIVVQSDWPTAQAHTKKSNDTRSQTEPYEMKWLSKPGVPYANIVRSNGEVVVRTTPNPTLGGKYWVHPGFKKYNFLRRGIEKGVRAYLESLGGELLMKHVEAGGAL